VPVNVPDERLTDPTPPLHIGSKEEVGPHGMTPSPGMSLRRAILAASAGRH
jgi:hypothetical protein